MDTNTAGQYNMNSLGTVTLRSRHPSWEDIFVTVGKNLLRDMLISYNIFSGLGQALDPINEQFMYWNIDNGQYEVINKGNVTPVNSGVDARLQKYGIVHSIDPIFATVTRGEAYWDLWQTYMATEYISHVAKPWPTLLDDQFNRAQIL